MEESKIKNRVFELQIDMMIGGKDYKKGTRKTWKEWNKIMGSSNILEMHCSYLNFK